MKKILFSLVLAFVALVGQSQTIAINTAEFDVSSPYGQGANISLPITLSSNTCLDTTNIFNLYLCDIAGNIVSGSIGTFKGFFTTYVNGIIPTSTSPGTYTLKIQSTSPVVLSPASPSFTIAAASPSVLAKVNPTVTNRILSDQLYFGWCSTQQPGLNSTLSLQNLCSSGSVVSFSLKDGNGNITNPTLSGSNVNILLQQTYYTLTVKALLNGTMSTKSYFLINTPNNLSLSTNGQQKPCYPDSVNFQIGIAFSSGGIANNFPGMKYRVDWNDGSSSYYKQCDLVNANGIISHLYTSSSCGNGQGAYFVTPKLLYPYFDVNNPSPGNCDDPLISTQANVFSKPFAKFQNAAKGCVNTAITFKNTSDPGLSKGANPSSCNVSGNYFWYVNDSLVYQSAAPETVPPSLVYTFKTAGTYKIQLSLDNSSCTISDTIRYICIEPKTVPVFTMNGFTSFSGCAPVSPTIVNATLPSNCGAPTYNWSVLDSLGNPTVPTNYYTITPSISTATPTITITQPGKYQIQLCATNSCGIVCTNENVTVSGKPFVTLPAAKSYCGLANNNTIDFGTNPFHKPTYDIQYGNTPTYQWSVTPNTFSTANGTTLTSQYPQITFNNLGTYTVSLTYTNNCGASQTVSQQISFGPVPTFTAPSSQVVCGGSPTAPISFTSTPVGATFTWTNNNASIGIPISGSGNISSYTTTKPITQQIATITVTASNGCPSAPQSFTITVNPKPATPTVISPFNYCQGNTAIPLTATAANGDTLKWYDASNIQLPTAPTPSTTTTGATTYFVSQINTTSGCESDKASTTVIVSATTAIDTLSTSNPTVCQSSTGTITLKGLLPNTGYILNYNKNGNPFGANNITSDANGHYTISGLSAGAYSNIIVGANNCASNSLGPINLSDPNPPATPTASSNSPICSGSTLTLNANSATVGVTYAWSGPNSFTSFTQNPTITNATVAATGTYSVTATLNGCSSIGTVNVVVNQTPAAPDVTNDTLDFCQFSTPGSLSATNTPGNTLQWYATAAGGTASASAPALSTTAVGTFYYYVSQINTTTSCESARTQIVVNVSDNTTIDTASTKNPSACQGTDGNIVLKGLVTGKNYTLNYSQNNTPVAPISFTAASSNYTIAGLSSGTYTNIIISLNGCQSNSLGPIKLTDPNAPATPVVGSNSPICSGATLSLTAASATAGVSYSWTGANGFVSALQNPTLANATTAAAGTYSVIATLNSCASAPANVVVVVNQTPVAPTVSSNTPVCEGGTIALTATTTTTGTIAYSWTGPNLFTSNVQNPNINNATVANSGNYIATATNTTGSCSSSSSSTNVVVNGKLINTISSAPQTVCASQSVTVAGQTPSGGDGTFAYQWQQSADSINWTNISGDTSINITYSPTATVYLRRVVTSSTCTLPSNAALITVQPGVGNNIVSKDTAICPGGSVSTITGTLPTGGNGIYTYQWESSIDTGATWIAIANATNINYLPVAPTITTQYRRRVSSNLCFGPQAAISNTVTITVNPDAKAQFTYTKDVACAPFDLAANIQNITNSANGSYIWYANNGQIGTGAAMPAYSITNPFDSVIIKLKAISQYGCKSDSLQHKFYTIPKPATAFTLSDTVSCGSLNISFINKTPNANFFNFKWDFGNGVTSTVANPLPMAFQSNPTRSDTVYIVTLSAYTSCDSIVTTQKIRIKSKPQALFTPNKTVGCSPLPITFTNTSSQGNSTTYVWDYGDGSPQFATNNTNAVQHTFSTGVQDTFKVKLIAINECGNDTLTYKIVVSPNKIKLNFAVNGNEVASCLPSTVHFINNTTGATSFNWNFGDGNVLTTTKGIDTVVHTYTTAGSYTASLDANNGCSDTTAYQAINVFAKPITKFVASPLTACLGDSVHFTNQTDTATGFTWRFGDGNTSFSTSPVYLYKTTGSYTATLVAVRQYSGIACTDSASASITVVSKLTGSFKVSDSVSSCVPFNVVFTNLSLPSALTTWDYNDGSKKDTGDIVQHTYTATGTFNVKMDAVNAGGCTYEVFKTIVVKGPVGSWVYDHGLICAKKQVQFQVNAQNTDSLRFNFGDGTYLTTTSPIVYHTYTQSGNYLPSVDLLAGTSCHITLQGTDTIKIENLKAGYTINQQKTCGSTTLGFCRYV